jgi:hypothetical protein
MRSAIHRGESVRNLASGRLDDIEYGTFTPPVSPFLRWGNTPRANPVDHV